VQPGPGGTMVIVEHAQDRTAVAAESAPAAATVAS